MLCYRLLWYYACSPAGLFLLETTKKSRIDLGSYLYYYFIIIIFSVSMVIVSTLSYSGERCDAWPSSRLESLCSTSRWLPTGELASELGGGVESAGGGTKTKLLYSIKMRIKFKKRKLASSQQEVSKGENVEIGGWTKQPSLTLAIKQGRRRASESPKSSSSMRIEARKKNNAY